MKRRAFLSFLAVAAAAAAADGRPRASTPQVRQEIVTVIEQQLTAFRQGEAAKAYRLATQELQRQKPLSVFSSIVQSSYPEIWQSTRAEFGIVRDDGNRATVTVHVYARATDAPYDYTLVKEKSGWRIHGVVRHSGKSSGKV